MTFLSISVGEVHLWEIPLDLERDLVAVATQLLQPSEIQRAQRFSLHKHRQQFVLSRAVQRDILSRYVQYPAKQICFQYGGHGKPFLSDCAVQFNLSNSGDYAYFALTLYDQVGVDIEQMRPNVEILGIAKRFFSPKEYIELQQLPAEQRLDAFYRFWTLKEAYVKALGLGLAVGLDRFAVSIKGSGELVAADNTDVSCVLRSIEAPTGYKAALALMSRELNSVVRCSWCEFC